MTERKDELLRFEVDQDHAVELHQSEVIGPRYSILLRFGLWNLVLTPERTRKFKDELRQLLYPIISRNVLPNLTLQLHTEEADEQPFKVVLILDKLRRAEITTIQAHPFVLQLQAALDAIKEREEGDDEVHAPRRNRTWLRLRNRHG